MDASASAANAHAQNDLHETEIERCEQLMQAALDRIEKFRKERGLGKSSSLVDTNVLGRPGRFEVKITSQN